MTHLTDRWVVPWLAILAEWSVRWGVVIAVLVTWFVLRPPRRAATRYLLCLAVLAAGLLLPVTPRWGHAAVPGPSWGWLAAGGSPGSEPSPVRSHGAAGPVVAPEAAHRRPSRVAPESVRQTGPVQLAAGPVPDQPTTAPLDVWRSAALTLAGGWAAVALAMLSRLAVGRLMLARLLREAVEVGWKSDRLLSECRAALEVSRPVVLAVHPWVASPVVVGGPRPVVLVPTDWGDWPEPNRRACLLHELAHLARYDDWAKLAQELLRAPFFFHPMVSWLLARLDRERELLCDETTVALGSDRVAYARLLLDLGRRRGGLCPVTRQSRIGWLPFFDHRTVKVRIERLLEDDMMCARPRPSTYRSFLLGSLAAAIALGLGGLRVHAVSAGPTEPPKRAEAAAEPQEGAESPASQTPPVAVAKEVSKQVRGVVVDSDDRPVAGATIVAGSCDVGRSGHQIITTNAQGRFTWPFPPGAQRVCLVAHKDGLTASARLVSAGLPDNLLHDDKIRLGKPASFAAVLVDGKGRPVVGARVRVEWIVQSTEQRYEYRDTRAIFRVIEPIRYEVVANSSVESLFVTTTDADGAFSFRAFDAGAGLKLRATAVDGHTLVVRSSSGAAGRPESSMEAQGLVTVAPGETIRLEAVPAARIDGRVVTKLPGVSVSGLTAYYQASRAPGPIQPTTNSDEGVQTDARGRFTFDGLNEGTINVVVHGGGEHRDWTYRAARDVNLTLGATSEVTVELIRGVEVRGTVVAQGTGALLDEVQVGVSGPARPRTSTMTLMARTDAQGRYHFRLPSGETYFSVSGPPHGFTRLPNERSTRTVTIPDGASRYEVPPIELAAAVTIVRGRVVNAIGTPIAGAVVVGISERGFWRPVGVGETLTDAQGEFRISRSLCTVAVGKAAGLLVRLRGGTEYEAAAIPSKDGAVTVKLPVAGEDFKGIDGPRDVAPDELAGVVVDVGGKPIEGAEVDAWTWYPGHEAKTDAKGFFRIGKLDKDRKVEVIVRKPGYTPQLFLLQPTGAPDWVVVLGNKTYFEGRVTGPDGKPVAGALLDANNGPKWADGCMITEISTEATTDRDGRYRMYARPDVYDILVRAPGVGVARLPDTSLGTDEAKRLDIRLE